MINEELKQARLSQGLSLRKLEELSGVGFSHIRRIEDGADASTSTINKICRALGLKLTTMKDELNEMFLKISDNEKLAEILKKKGYRIPTFGWDKIEGGHYLEYADKKKTWCVNDDLLGLRHESESDHGSFVYHEPVTADVVAVLRTKERLDSRVVGY